MDQKKFSLNIREKLLQSLYDMVNNDELYDEMQKAFSNLDEFVTGILPGCDVDERIDQGIGLICDLEHAAFMAGANMTLDFISGREVR